MCETCTEAPGASLVAAVLAAEVRCDCPCPIRKDTRFLKFRPLICSECCHVALP